ncbi:hypothetical protein EES42_41730 [Streptomyces sp. ADI95-17]|nr:hypothetical protein EES42_41730 [Streptomyces sp. ADI95-17]
MNCHYRVCCWREYAYRVHVHGNHACLMLHDRTTTQRETPQVTGTANDENGEA